MRKHISLILIIAVLFTALPIFIIAEDEATKSDFVIGIYNELELRNKLMVPGFEDIIEYEYIYSDWWELGSREEKAAFAFMIKNNIIKGNDGMLLPGASISRADACVILYRVTESIMGNGNDLIIVNPNASFTDVDDSFFAKEQIIAMAKAGIVNGNEDGTFNPLGNFYVEHISVITGRLADAINKVWGSVFVQSYEQLIEAMNSPKAQICVGEDITIPYGDTFTVSNGKNVTVNEGVTLTNNGTIIVEAATGKHINGGVVFVQGILENTGTIINKGASNSGTYDSDNNYGNFIGGGRVIVFVGAVNNTGFIINEAATVPYADSGRLSIGYKGIVNNNAGGEIICRGAANEGLADIENQWGNRVSAGAINLEPQEPQYCGILSNYGSIIIEPSGEGLRNADSGMIDAYGTIKNYSTITNNGYIRIEDSFELINNGHIYNNGFIDGTVVGNEVELPQQTEDDKTVFSSVDFMNVPADENGYKYLEIRNKIFINPVTINKSVGNVNLNFYNVTFLNGLTVQGGENYSVDLSKAEVSEVILVTQDTNKFDDKVPHINLNTNMSVVTDNANINVSCKGNGQFTLDGVVVKGDGQEDSDFSAEVRWESWKKSDGEPDYEFVKVDIGGNAKDITVPENSKFKSFSYKGSADAKINLGYITAPKDQPIRIWGSKYDENYNTNPGTLSVFGIINGDLEVSGGTVDVTNVTTNNRIFVGTWAQITLKGVCDKKINVVGGLGSRAVIEDATDNAVIILDCGTTANINGINKENTNTKNQIAFAVNIGNNEYLIYDIKEAEFSMMEVHVASSLAKISNPATIIFAAYDENNKLIGVIRQNLTAESSNYSFNLKEFSGVKIIKAFLWSSVSNLMIVGKSGSL